MHVKPLGDRVVVKPRPKEERSKGGIFLPDTASKERPMEGEIIAVGPGSRDRDGALIAMSVKPGQHVVFAKYSGTEFKIRLNRQ